MFKKDTLEFYKTILATCDAKFVEQTAQQRMLIELPCGHTKDIPSHWLLAKDKRFDHCKQCKRENVLKNHLATRLPIE